MGLSHSPSIVTDGLDFYVDPNNTRCYPGFGNTIYNIVNSSIGGTLVGYTSNPMDSTQTRSFNFDGVNDFIDIVNSSSWNFSSLSICIWFKKNQGSVFKGVVDKGRDNYGAWSLCIDETANRVTFKVRIGGVNRSVTTSSNYTFNGWTFIAGVFDGSNLSIYQNESISSTATYFGSIGTNSYNIRIGADNDGNCVAGLISSVFIYSKGLSAAEINQNYHATKKKYLIEENIVTNGLILNLDPGNPNSYSGAGNTIYDLAGFGNTGIIVNGPAFSGINGGSLSYDGTNDYMYVQHNNSQNLTYITVSAWFNFPVVPFSGLGINKESSFRLMSAESYTTTAGGRLGGSWGTGVGPGATTLSPNRWYQIVMTADGTTQKLYVNGSLDYTLNNSALASINSNVLSFATYHFGSSNFMNCQMSQALIYNRALSATEIQQNYNATKGRFLNPLPPVRNGLVLELDAANTSSYSGFGNTWYDLTGNGYNYTLTNGPVFSSFGTTQNFFFDGSNDRALAVNPISLGTTHTVSMIIKPSSGGILFGDFAYSNTGYAFYLTGSNLYYAATDFVSTSITFTTNWIMFTVTRNGTSISFYQNGILLSSQTLGGNNPLTLRSIADFDGGGFPFAGNISQVSCYNRALSAYEIKQNFDYYRTRYGI